MCGICGIIKFDGTQPEESRLLTMMRTMKHRGPDDEGTWLHEQTGFGFVRLSILDLSADGHQPMHSSDGNLTIVFNGEIYNYIELKAELSKSYTFKSQTDTEVILAAYLKWGKECLHRFNGMFTIAIYDKRNKEVFLARDRYGIKPLFYYAGENEFIFASEMPSLLKVLPVKPEPDNQSIYDYLVFNRTNHTANTFISQIKKVEHGYCFSIRNNEIKKERWYNLRERVKQGSSVSPDEFRELFISSNILRMRSDVPVGALLSGGLDSSSIVATVLKHHPVADFNTFSAVYKAGQRGDETPFIKLFEGEKLKVHYCYPSAESFLADMDQFVEALQEPVPGTSIYAEFKVYELAKNFVTVLLNGQGADEEMAGYLYFSGYFYKELFYQLRLMKLLREMQMDFKNHQSAAGIKSFVYFMLPALLRDKVSASAAGYLSGEFKTAYKGDESFLKHLFGSPTLHDALLNHFEYKFEHNLVWGDRNSMWHSLEVRFPFLDYRFVEMTLSLPNEEILNNGETKVMLRKALRGITPDAILNRHDKVGFETPEADWFREKKFKELVSDILNSSSFKNRGYIDKNAALKKHHQHIAGEKNNAQELWKMVHLELWFRKFLESNN